PTEFSPLSLHDALPISGDAQPVKKLSLPKDVKGLSEALLALLPDLTPDKAQRMADACFAPTGTAPRLSANSRRRLPAKRYGVTQDRKSTRLNSSHVKIS